MPMESTWSRAKRAIALNLCVQSRGDDGNPPDDVSDGLADVRLSDASASAASSAWSSTDSGHRLLLPGAASPIGASKYGRSKSSKSSTCMICLGRMKAGPGHAIFTAECSHAFHFHCISSNVQHGNLLCPVCRSSWTEIPLHDPSLPHGPHTLRSPTAARPHQSRHHQPPEPAVFNDDESVQQFEPQNGTLIQSKSVEIETYTEYGSVCQSECKGDFAILVKLRAPHASSNPRVPVDLVTVLDVSGSMAGTKLALLKRAMGFVIQNLGPLDRLSVVAFSSSARRLFPLRWMSDSGRQLALQAVNSLTAGGGTNIAEALRKGAKVIEDRSYRNPVSSIILLSDGQDTYTGPCNNSNNKGGGNRLDYKSLVANRQIPVHTFGFGTDHDAAAMHSIAEASGGTFSFIEDEGVIQDAFAQCIGGLLSVVVQKMRVSLEIVDPAVRLVSVKSGSYTSLLAGDGRTGLIEVGDLYADEERDFLVLLRIPQATAGDVETKLIKVGCAYKDPVTKEKVISEYKQAAVYRPQFDAEETISIEVDRARNRTRAAEAMAAACAAAERGALSDAVTVLELERRLVGESFAGRTGDRLCLALDAELREMQERMASRRRYEASGRAYMLSGLSSHSWQRATARGDSTDCDSLVRSYQTPSMVSMLHRSQTLCLSPVPRQPVRPTRSFVEWAKPR